MQDEREGESEALYWGTNPEKKQYCISFSSVMISTPP